MATIPNSAPPCTCGNCPQCDSAARSSGRTARNGDRTAQSGSSQVPGGGAFSHRNWRDRRNARYYGSSGSPAPNSWSGPILGEISGARPTAPVIRLGRQQKQALEKKWTGKMNAATNGMAKNRYKRYADNIRNGERPSPDQSEKDLLPWIKRHATVFYKPGRVIEIKNYTVQFPGSLIRLLRRKAGNLRGMRASHSSFPLIVLDIRGQSRRAGNLFRLIDRLAERSGYPAGKIKLVTW
jgi:hypothetical protein